MPRDDQVFFSDMSASADAFNEATTKCLGFGGWIREQEVEAKTVRLQHYHTYFHGLGRISGGTEPVIERIKLQIAPRLKPYEVSNNEGPIPVIRGKLDGWQGPEGSASYGFKWRYLPKLANAMETKYSVMQAMAAVMMTHEGIIDQARQKYLDLLASTTSAYDANTAQRERSSSLARTVSTVVGAISAGMAIGAPAGPVAGPVFGLIGGIGTYIDSTATDPGTGDWFSITDDTLAKLDAMVTAIEEETHSVESALDAALVYVDGKFSDQFLAPQVNSTGLAPGES